MTPEQIAELNAAAGGTGGTADPEPQISIVDQGRILAAQAERRAAREKLDGLMTDPAWGKRMLENEPAALEEFHKLTAQVSSDDPTPTLEGMQEASRSRAFNAAADAFADQHGLSPEIAKQVKADTPVTETEMKNAKAWMERHSGDQAWVVRLMKGDIEAVREFATCNVVLASRVIPDQARAP